MGHGRSFHLLVPPYVNETQRVWSLLKLRFCIRNVELVL